MTGAATTPGAEHLPRVIEEAAELLRAPNPAAITATTTMQDLGGDSLDAVEIAFALEDAFSVELAQDQLDGITVATTMADLAGLVAQAKARAA